MKKILFIFIAVLISVNASATKYYIATAANGGDNGNSGTIGSPWLTLAYACTQVVTAGDTIFVTAGNYLENDPCNLAVGVSIMGVGEGSFIYSNDTDQILNLDSAVENTPGNQSISYLKFSGEVYTNDVCMYINGRGNVEIHHCWFEEFRIGAIRIKGNLAGGDIEPGTYSTGNKIYDCSFNDCARRVAQNGYGAISHGGQDGLLIYNNTIIQEAAGNENGYCIKYIDFGHSKNVKIYDNYMRRTADDGYSAIAIEIWNGEGGNEIYNNTILGGSINPAGSYSKRGTSAFSFDIHHNTLGLSAIGNQATYVVGGVSVEGGAEDLYVHHNIIRNAGYGLSVSVGQAVTANRIYFDYNIIHNWGTTNNKIIGALGLVVRVTGSTMNNVYFRNNVIYNDGTNDPRYCVFYNPKEGNINNINFINNIFMGTGTTHAWMAGVGNAPTGPINIDRLNILNNIIYDNGSNTYTFGAGITVTNAVESGSINSDPLFIGGSPYSYKLQSTSPAIDAGLEVGLSYDYDGKPIYLLPDMGAYEFGTFPASSGLGWQPKYFKENVRDSLNIDKGLKIKGEPMTASARSLNRVEGVTSNVQGQINSLENDKLEKINAALSTGTITDATGITAGMLSRYMYYSEAAATDISSDPQIADGTPGQIITIIGSSDTNTLTLDDSTGLRLSAQCVLGAGDTITLYYDGTLADWIEIGRSNN